MYIPTRAGAAGVHARVGVTPRPWRRSLRAPCGDAPPSRPSRLASRAARTCTATRPERSRARRPWPSADWPGAPRRTGVPRIRRTRLSLDRGVCGAGGFKTRKIWKDWTNGLRHARAAAGGHTGLQEFRGTASVGIASKTSPVLCSRPRVTFLRVPLRSHPCGDRGMKNWGRRRLIFPASSWVVIPWTLV